MVPHLGSTSPELKAATLLPLVAVNVVVGGLLTWLQLAVCAGLPGAPLDVRRCCQICSCHLPSTLAWAHKRCGDGFGEGQVRGGSTRASHRGSAYWWKREHTWEVSVR